LQERSILLRVAVALARHRNDLVDAERLERRARECDDKSRTIRGLLQDPSALGHERFASARIEVVGCVRRRGNIHLRRLLNLCKCV
jgi:hypothetical protein